MSQPASLASKVVSRSVLIVVIVISSLGILASLLYGALAQDPIKSSMSMDVYVAGGLPRPNIPNAKADVQFKTVSISSFPGLTRADPLVAVATAIPSLVFGLTCLVLLILAIQMLRRKPFGLAVAISMLTIAAVCIASGFARPALEAQAEQLYVTGLGLPTSWEGHPVWLVPTYSDWTDSDWPFIMIGLLIALGGWLVLRARQLRLDLEGTI